MPLVKVYSCVIQDAAPESVDTLGHRLTMMSLKKRSSHDTHRHSRSNSGSHIEVRSQTSSRTLDQHDTVRLVTLYVYEHC